MKRRQSSIGLALSCVAAIVLAGCSPAAPAPAATAAPTAKPAATAVQSAAKPTAVAAKPAEKPAAAVQASAGGDKEYDQATIDAAKKEGSVLFLTGSGQGNSGPKLAEAFQKRYGIKLEFEMARGAENEEKIRTQQRAGKVMADTISSAGSAAMRTVDVVDLPELPNSSNIWGTLRNFYAAMIPTYVNVYGVMVNKNRVQPNNYPRSWDDIVDPKWKGEIIMDDPARGGGGGNLLQSLLAAKGEPWLRKLAEQKPRITAQYPENEKALARGEYSIYIPAQVSAPFRLGQTAPVAYLEPSEGDLISTASMGLVKGAPHPNAAKLFLNFLLSKEAQTIYAVEGLVPVIGGVDVPLPEMAIERLKFIYSPTKADYEREEKDFTLAASIFGLVR